MRALERRASPEALEAAEIEVTLAAYDRRSAHPKRPRCTKAACCRIGRGPLLKISVQSALMLLSYVREGSPLRDRTFVPMPSYDVTSNRAVMQELLRRVVQLNSPARDHGDRGPKSEVRHPANLTDHADS